MFRYNTKIRFASSTVGCCVYIRHRQVLQWQMERGRDLVSRRIITATACCGILACFGLDILANFQEARVIAAHMVGAMTCFSAGTLYFCFQVHHNMNLVMFYPNRYSREKTLIYRQCCNHFLMQYRLNIYP